MTDQRPASSEEIQVLLDKFSSGAAITRLAAYVLLNEEEAYEASICINGEQAFVTDLFIRREDLLEVLSPIPFHKVHPGHVFPVIH